MPICFVCGYESAKTSAAGNKIYCSQCGEWTDVRQSVPPASIKASYSLEDVLQILRNVGADTKCGACMEIAFTGMTAAKHECSSGTLLRSITAACNKLGM
jgi:hypothetical protein